MAITQQDQTLLQKYTLVAKKIIYDPKRMAAFMKMLGTKEGALTAAQTVVSAVDKLKPVPPQLTGLLGVNAYMLMVDIAQEVTQHQPDPAIIKEVIGAIMQNLGAQQPAPQGQPGMLAQMQERGEPPEPAGDPTTPDNTAAHEGAEPAAMEQQEGLEEDPTGGEPAGMLARMQRRGVPA